MHEGGQQEIQLRGVLEGHGAWVTSISTASESNTRLVISGSRDKQLIVWDLALPDTQGPIGTPKTSLIGHGNTVSEVVLSNDGQYALSGSWDKTLRLWDIGARRCLNLFQGHEKPIFSVAFSPDNRQIVSAGQDQRIMLWNTLAECKSRFENAHDPVVSCVRFSPVPKLLVSGGWDNAVCVWNLETGQLRSKLCMHRGLVSSVAVSPDGSLCGSGGADGIAMLWDVAEGRHLYSLDAGSPLSSLCFSPCNYWLCGATNRSIMIWDLENKNLLVELKPERPHKSGIPWCTSLCWTIDGKTLLAGSSDGNIYVYEVKKGY